MGAISKFGHMIADKFDSWVNKKRREDVDTNADQAVQDIQKDTANLTTSVAAAAGELEALKLKQGRAENEANEWHSKAALALQSGDENLAKKALAHEATARGLADTLKKQVEATEARVSGFKENVSTLQNQKEAAIAQAEALKARAHVADAESKVNDSMTGINPDSAMARLKEVEERVTAKEGANAATADMTGVTDNAKLAKLQKDAQVSDGLAKLKAEMAAKNAPPPAPAAPQAPAQPDEWHIAR